MSVHLPKDQVKAVNATDKIKKEKQENQVAKENMKAKTKQTQDPPALRRSQRNKKNLTLFLIAVTF